MIWCSPLHRPVCLQLDSDAISMMVSCTTHRRACSSLEVRLKNPSQTCFHAKQAARFRRVSHVITSSHRFCAVTDKPKPACFLCPNQETVVMILRPKSPNRSCWVWGTKQKTLYHLGFEAQLRNRHHWFWGQTEETVTTGFEIKPEKTVLVVLRPNHSQTIDPGFEAQPRNSRSLSLRACCTPHMAPPDLSIARPPSTRPVRPCSVISTRSPTPTTILVIARHVASATCTLRDKQTRFFKRTKDKVKITEQSQIGIQTSPSQWLIIIKTRNWSIDFSMVTTRDDRNLELLT
jgi:hypothetical protein